MIEGASTAAAALEGKVTTIAEMLNGLKQLSDTLTAAELRIGALTMSLGEAGKEMAAGSKVWRETMAAEAKDVRTVLEEAGEAIAATGDELRRALVEPAREAGTTLAAIGLHADSLRESETQLTRLSAVLEKQIAVLSQLREESTGPRSFFNFPSRR